MRLSRFRIMLLAWFMVAAVWSNTPCHATTSTMTIALPADVIHRSLQNILPLNIDEPNKHVEGRLTLHSISKLEMGENSAVLQGLVIGKNVSIITQVGNQDLRIRIGDLELPLTCDLAFRYDPREKILYVIPRLRQPVPGSITDMANSVTSLLTMFNDREYPISLTSLQTLNARVGDQDISVDMEPVDIRVSKGQLIVMMLPRLSKTN
ncbi:MAG: hypothetical protein M8357_05105 [Desulfobulbaceae bacterium]|nr:hypothetical protein [Desulfobulbaceae bacterium]